MFIDGHCDTASVMLDEKKVLKKNDLQLDLTRMDKVQTQLFAAFIAPEYYDKPFERAEAIIAKLKKEIDKKTNKIELCTNNDERLAALGRGNRAAFISLEGGEPIAEVTDVERLYDMGVRFIAPVWNNANKIAGGVNSTDGLSTFGRYVLKECDRLGIITDLSHLNEHSFWEVMRVLKYPPIASHSCSAAVHAHPRNLTDEQFCAICNRGGVVGINFYTTFLNGRKKAKIKNVIKHIDHFVKLNGENHIGLGSDFDGVDSLPEGLSGVQDLPNLTAAMSEAGYSDTLINKICYGNFERVMRLL